MKKNTKSTQKPVTKMRWSLGLFTSAKSGEPVVAYCRTDGTVAPYLRKTVKNPKATIHMVYFGMSYAAARAKLVKLAGSKATKKSKKTSKEEIQRAA